MLFLRSSPPLRRWVSKTWLAAASGRRLLAVAARLFKNQPGCHDMAEGGCHTFIFRPIAFVLTSSPESCPFASCLNAAAWAISAQLGSHSSSSTCAIEQCIGVAFSMPHHRLMPTCGYIVRTGQKCCKQALRHARRRRSQRRGNPSEADQHFSKASPNSPGVLHTRLHDTRACY